MHIIAYKSKKKAQIDVDDFVFDILKKNYKISFAFFYFFGPQFSHLMIGSRLFNIFIFFSPFLPVFIFLHFIARTFFPQILLIIPIFVSFFIVVVFFLSPSSSSSFSFFFFCVFFFDFLASYLIFHLN